MSSQNKQRWALAWVALLLAVAGGCGGGSEGTRRSASTRIAPPGPCRAGGSIVPHVPDAPALWKSGPGTPIALSCAEDGVDPGAALVGYAIPGGGACVSAYGARLAEPLGELCEPPGSRWTIQCEGQGCVHYFWHTRKATFLDGPVAADARGVRVLVGGKPLRKGVIFATVRGRLMRAIRAEEPFGFFSVYVPRCLDPDEVKVELVGAGGKRLGVADPWDVAVQSCRRMT